MGAIEELYLPMNVTGENIDPRYFKPNDDGTYNATPLLIHNIARDATNYYKKRIFEIDEQMLYHTASVRELKDTWTEKKLTDEYNTKYADQLKVVDAKWKTYRAEHPDEFETKFKRIQLGGEDEARFFSGYSCDSKPGLTTTVQAYNAARELLARFAGPDKDGNAGPEYSSLPFEEPLYSKAEYAETHAQFKRKLYEDLGIPERKIEVGKIKKLQCRINNKKCDAAGTDDAELKTFIEGLIKYITSSNAIEFKAKRAELKTMITKDFIVNINDTTKNFKAQEGTGENIDIYIKSTIDSSPIKFISLVKDEPDDPYKYVFNVDTDGENLRYSKEIVTKADLRKALTVTKSMISEVDSFKKYSEDIDNILETL